MGIYDFDQTTPLQKQQIFRYGGNSPFFRNGKLVQPSGGYGMLADGYLNNGKLDMTSAGLGKVGSNAIAMQTAGFFVVHQSPFVDTSTVYWDGTNGSSIIVLHRSDKTSQAVPGGSVTISGLSPNTRYYQLPFWSNQNQCGIGWAQGTAGTPQICFTVNSDMAAAALQIQQDREPLSQGYMYFDTPATTGAGAGSTGGFGGDGNQPGAKSCVMLHTNIEPLEGIDYTAEHIPCTHWWHLVTENGKSLFCTPDHPVYDHHGFRKDAKDFKIGDWVTTNEGYSKLMVSEPHLRSCTKVKVTMPRLGLYWANGILSHNFKAF